MSDFVIEEERKAQGFLRIAGVDEAGRGPLAGPVVTAAVVLPPEWPSDIPLDDSKKLSPAVREETYLVIRGIAVAWGMAVIQPDEIDRVNILQATLKGMRQAVSRLSPAADYALVDGNQMPELDIPGEAIVKGDQRSLSIAAASVLAKVVRDRIMRAYSRRYPEWGFEQHKGYGTRRHLEALERYGRSPIHRASFTTG